MRSRAVPSLNEVFLVRETGKVIKFPGSGGTSQQQTGVDLPDIGKGSGSTKGLKKLVGTVFVGTMQLALKQPKAARELERIAKNNGIDSGKFEISVEATRLGPELVATHPSSAIPGALVWIDEENEWYLE